MSQLDFVAPTKVCLAEASRYFLAKSFYALICSKLFDLVDSLLNLGFEIGVAAGYFKTRDVLVVIEVAFEEDLKLIIILIWRDCRPR